MSDHPPLLSREDLADPKKCRCSWTECGISFLKRCDLLTGVPRVFDGQGGPTWMPFEVAMILAEVNDYWIFWCPACQKPNVLTHDASRRVPGKEPDKPLEFMLAKATIMPR